MSTDCRERRNKNEEYRKGSTIRIAEENHIRAAVDSEERQPFYPISTKRNDYGAIF